MSNQSSASGKLGFWSLFSFVVSSQIGVGIFMLPSSLACFGNIGLASWVITGLGVINLGIIFSKLCSWFPETGGPPLYVSKAFGEQAGFCAAWTYWSINCISSVPVLATLAANVLVFTGPLSTFNILLIEFGILGVILLINLMGLEIAGTWEVVLTSIKIALLIIFPLAIFQFMNLDHFSDFNPSGLSPFTAINTASLLTLWGFIGIESATTSSGSVVNPTRTVPRALILGTLTVMVIYLMNTFSIMGVVPREILTTTTRAYSVTAGILWGGVWDKILAGFILLVGTSSFHAWILISGQTARGGAERGFFPDSFKKTNARGAPSGGLLWSATWFIVTMFLFMSQDLAAQIKNLIDLSVATYLLIYASCVLAFIKVIYQQRGTYGTWTNFALGGGGLAFCCWTLYGVALAELLYSLFLPFLGLLFYYGRRWFMKPKINS